MQADKKNTFIRYIKLQLLMIALSAIVSSSIYEDALNEDILSDPQNLITEQFKIPKNMKKRVQFWFKVYTEYDSNIHIIHHSIYPWIIFDIVDVSKINTSNMHKWTKFHKAKKLVAKIQKKVERSLYKIHKRKKLNDFDRKISQQLKKELGGNINRAARIARKNVRSQLGQKDRFNYALNEFPYFEKQMLQIFSENNLPEELILLPFVESSFNTKAFSKAGASGIWQFMPKTARKYLIVKNHIDERNSPLKATKAAAKLLGENFKYLKSWPLAVTAYNHGMGGVKKALKISKTTKLEDLVNSYYKGAFKVASANFYSCFLATLYAVKYKDLIPNLDLSPKPPAQLKRIKVKNRITVRKLARKLQISIKELVKHNLDLKKAIKRNFYIPKGFTLFLPQDFSVEKISWIDRVDHSPTPSAHPLVSN